ncbi:MAG: hypothetical protein ACK5AO_04525 [bacterium]
MRKITFTLGILLTVSSAFAQWETSKQIFKSPNFDQVVASAKTVAILPFNVGISYKKMPKGMTLDMVKENERQESTQMQQGMYTYLLRKSNDYSVTFQDVDRTNALLKKAGVFETLGDIMADSICKILNVDAVIKCNWSYAKTGSEAGAIASAMLLGVGKGTGSGQLVMQINQAKEGELVWRMSKEMNEGAFSSANELMERMMRKVGRVFPFAK